MAKDPAVLWYTSDFLTGTSHFTNEEVGVYIRLLAHQHQQGRLSIDFIKRITGKNKFERVWPNLQDKFKSDESGVYNERMEKEILRRAKNSSMQKEKAIYSWEVRRNGNATASATAMPINETEIETETETGFKDRGTGETMKGWNHMPIPAEAGELPELTCSNAAELILRTKKIIVPLEDVKALWPVFLDTNLTGKKFYADVGAVRSHFINWIKTQNFIDGNNGSKSIAKNTGKSEGTNRFKHRKAQQFNAGRAEGN